MELTTAPTIDSGGFHKLRSGPNAEVHRYDPQTILTLQQAVRSGSYETFQALYGPGGRRAPALTPSGT